MQLSEKEMPVRVTKKKERMKGTGNNRQSLEPHASVSKTIFHPQKIPEGGGIECPGAHMEVVKAENIQARLKL